VVRAIFIDLRSSRELVYGVESNGSSSPDDDDGAEAGGGHYSFLLEGQLAFASNCRIRARGMLDERDPDDAGLEGVILCPLFPPPLSYAVRFHLGGTGEPTRDGEVRRRSESPRVRPVAIVNWRRRRRTGRSKNSVAWGGGDSRLAADRGRTRVRSGIHSLID
jgi:hypothetical protein